MNTNYSYQKTAAVQVLENLLNPKYLSSVLAACPGAGKTTISQMVINSYVGMSSDAKVLVLTEGQTTLKNQYLQELESSHIKINFTFGGLDSDAQVRVGLPQGIGQLSWDKIDLLVVDEAHNFFFADMVQAIIRKLKPTHKLLMTGSPTKFNLHNQVHSTQYGMHYVSAEELQKMGVFSPVNMDVVKTIDSDNASQSILDVLAAARHKRDNVSKLMVACPSVEYAKQVAATLKTQGYKVSLSTAQTDKDNLQIANFKKNETNALVVVGKGILGFNDSNITMLVDMKSSSNIDTSYQLFARVLRKHSDKLTKTYYRIADKDYNNQVLTLHKMLALMKKPIFMGFTGKNIKLEIS